MHKKQNAEFLLKDGVIYTAVNTQGVLGEGILGYKVMLSIHRVYLEKAPWCSLLITVTRLM